MLSQDLGERVLWLTFGEGHSHARISLVLKISQRTVTRIVQTILLFDKIGCTRIGRPHNKSNLCKEIILILYLVFHRIKMLQELFPCKGNRILSI